MKKMEQKNARKFFCIHLAEAEKIMKKKVSRESLSLRDSRHFSYLFQAGRKKGCSTFRKIYNFYVYMYIYICMNTYIRMFYTYILCCFIGRKSTDIRIICSVTQGRGSKHWTWDVESATGIRRWIEGLVGIRAARVSRDKSRGKVSWKT